MPVNNSLKSLSTILKKEQPSKIILVTAEFLSLKLDWAISEIKKSAEVKIIKIPNGEGSKELNVLEKLLTEFIKNDVDRKSIIIAFGGGTTTDLVGFAASIYLRGIKYINIPTTLLGQVDASIGGKTAINFKGYKNQIGSFCKPIAVISDTRFLNTLNEAQIIDGLAEIIKAGLVKDKFILELIKSYKLSDIKNKAIIEKLISKSVAVKEHFVKKDLEDKGLRQILNFGHTIGHAVEIKYKLSHGQAVLIGMMEELKMGEKLGKTKPEVRKLLNEIYNNLGIYLNSKIKIDWRAVYHDKKVLGKEIVLPIVTKTGDAELIKVKLDKFVSLN